MDGRSFPRRTLVPALLGLAAATAPVWAGNDAWTVAGRPSGGIVSRVTVDPATPSTLFAVSGPGLFQSTDSGATWNLVLSIPTNIITDVAFDPLNAQVVYAAGQGVFKSTDGGKTWASASTGMPHVSGIGLDGVYEMSLDPVNEGTLYCITDNSGIYKTVDGGNTWNAANTGLANLLKPTEKLLTQLAVDPMNPQVLYLSTQVPDPTTGIFADDPLSGIYTSSDGGAHWTQSVTNMGFRDVVVDPNDDQNVYAGSLTLYASTNGGGSWAPAGNPLNEMDDILAIDPTDSMHMWGSRSLNGLYQTTDGGTTWTLVPTGSADWFLSIAVDPKTPANVYLGSANFGLLKSTDGGSTWAESDSGIYGITVNQMFMDASGVIYLGADGSGMYKSTDQGVTWTQVNTGITEPLTIGIYVYGLTEDPKSATTLYAATQTGLFKTTNAGGDWSLLSNGISDSYSMAVAVDPENSRNVYVGTQGHDVFKSTDAGASWQAASTGMSDHEVMSLAVSPTDSNTVFAGTGSQGVFKSTDGGSSWAPVNNGLPVTGVWAIAIDPTNANTLYASLTNKDIYKSTDGGSTWSDASTGLQTGGIFTSIQIDPSNPSILYVSPLVGAGDVFVSTDGAAHWIDLTTGKPAPALSSARAQGIVQPLSRSQWISKTPSRAELVRRTLVMTQASSSPGTIGAVAADPRSMNVYGADKAGQIYVLNAAGVSSTPSSGSGGGSGGGTSGGGGAFSLFAGLLLGLGLLRRRA